MCVCVCVWRSLNNGVNWRVFLFREKSTTRLDARELYLGIGAVDILVTEEGRGVRGGGGGGGGGG